MRVIVTAMPRGRESDLLSLHRFSPGRRVTLFGLSTSSLSSMPTAPLGATSGWWQGGMCYARCRSYAPLAEWLPSPMWSTRRLKTRRALTPPPPINSPSYTTRMPRSPRPTCVYPTLSLSAAPPQPSYLPPLSTPTSATQSLRTLEHFSLPLLQPQPHPLSISRQLDTTQFRPKEFNPISDFARVT